MSKARIIATSLTASAAGLALWVASEGLRTDAYIPTKGDVPTIGAGATFYEDGTKVKLGDKITREYAEKLAQNHLSGCAWQVASAIPGVKLNQTEMDLYANFTCQFGIGNFRKSSMRRNLIAGDYRAACDSLLKYRYQAGRDCSLSKNWGPKGCKGVWTRQLERHAMCIGAL